MRPASRSWPRATSVWDARSYLVTAGSDAVLIDGNGNLAPLVAHARATGSVIHAVLLTHTHEDHVAGVAELSASGMPGAGTCGRAGRLPRP